MIAPNFFLSDIIESNQTGDFFSLNEVEIMKEALNKNLIMKIGKTPCHSHFGLTDDEEAKLEISVKNWP